MSKNKQKVLSLEEKLKIKKEIDEKVAKLEAERVEFIGDDPRKIAFQKKIEEAINKAGPPGEINKVDSNFLNRMSAIESMCFESIKHLEPISKDMINNLYKLGHSYKELAECLRESIKKEDE